MSATVVEDVRASSERAAEGSVTTVEKRPYLYQPGHAPTGGRPKGSRDLWPQFYEAMRKVEKEKAINMFVHAWKLALTDSKLLAKMLDKLVPNLTNEVGNKGSVTINILSLSSGNSASLQISRSSPGQISPPVNGNDPLNLAHISERTLNEVPA